MTSGASTRTSERFTSWLQRRGGAPLFFLAPPLLAATMATPFVVELGLDAPETLLSHPFGLPLCLALFLGALSAPGYYRCWRRRESREAVTAGVANWLRLSLVAAVLSGILGTIVGCVTVVPGVLSGLFVAGAVVLRVQFERRGIAAELATSPQSARWLWIPAVFTGAFVVQRWLEHHGKNDSLGLWYSIYCAATYTAIIVLAGAAAVGLVRSSLK